MQRKWMVGTLLVALCAGVGCAKSATVRPEERTEQNPAPVAETKPAETKAKEAGSSSEEVAKTAPARTGKVEEATLGGPVVYFGYDADTLAPAARENLEAFAEQYRKRGGKAGVIRLEGHADERGTEEYNLTLGQRRANAVRTYLVRLGVDAKHLQVVSFGENKPAVQGEDEAAFAKNRRVEIVPPQLTSSLK